MASSGPAKGGLSPNEVHVANGINVIDPMLPPYSGHSQPESSGTAAQRVQQPSEMDGGPVPPSSPLRAESSSNSSSQGSKPKYHIATPLALLGRCASPVDCPVCGERALTKVIYKVGNTTHVWAAGLFATTILLSPLPYLFNSTKDRDHRCGNCDILLATWHKSGSVDVHQFVIS